MVTGLLHCYSFNSFCHTGASWSGRCGPSEKAPLGEAGESFLSNYGSDEQRPPNEHQWLWRDQRRWLCHGNGPGVCGLQVRLGSICLLLERSCSRIWAVVFFTTSDKWRSPWETSWWSARSVTTCTTRTVTSPRWRIKTWTIRGWSGTAPAAPGKWSAW